MNITDAFDVCAAYLECAAWADKPEGCEASDFDAASVERAECECKAFLYRALPWLDAWTPEQAGHDFWLTRNRHGSGFWDRGLQYGDILTNIAHGFGELNVELRDDNLLEIK
jgi:hypothetical protein